jgi:hypothetical protein
MTRTLHQKASRVGTKASELSLAAPQVVAHRMARLLSAGVVPSVHDQREFMRMGTEKVEAFVESWGAMSAQALQAQHEMMASMLQAWCNPWAWATSPVEPLQQLQAQAQHSMLSLIEQGVDPLHRRAVANAKRLSRGK